MEGDGTTRDGLDYDYGRETSQQGGTSFADNEFRERSDKLQSDTAAQAQKDEEKKDEGN